MIAAEHGLVQTAVRDCAHRDAAVRQVENVLCSHLWHAGDRDLAERFDQQTNVAHGDRGAAEPLFAGQRAVRVDALGAASLEHPLRRDVDQTMRDVVQPLDLGADRRARELPRVFTQALDRAIELAFGRRRFGLKPGGWQRSYGGAGGNLSCRSHEQ